jgi:predicted amidohydrolase
VSPGARDERASGVRRSGASASDDRPRLVRPDEAPSVRVAVAQTAPRVGDVGRNLADAERTIEALAGQADLVVFPELFTTGYRREGMDHVALAEPVPHGPSVARLADAARRAGVAVAGTLLERDAGTVYDTAVLLGRDGRFLARYRKTHLYPAEADFFGAGDELVVVPTDLGLGVGLAICFEHAFPEVFTALALAGASLIVICSAVPVGYEYLLELRTRARAQDNQVFVAAANLVGFDGQQRWCGRSAIADPRGEVLAEADAQEPQVIIARLDIGAVRAERAQEPALALRRPELYPVNAVRGRARAPAGRPGDSGG